MKVNPTEREYQNIITQEPELVMAALNQNQIALLKNPRYLSLVKIIHEKGPLTIVEMTKEYAELAKDDQAKSESTVYRYLTLLKENNLVQEAGQRVIEGQTLTKTLYSLPARYLILDEPEIDWEGSHGQAVFKELVKILKILYPDKSIDEKALFQWQLRFQHIVDPGKRKLINSKEPEILELLSVWAPYNINDLIESTGWMFVLLEDPSAQQNFLNFFITSFETEPASLSSSIDNTGQKEPAAFLDAILRLPEAFCVLSSEDPRNHYFEKPDYIPLFHVLREGAMTIKELVERYNQVAMVPRKLSTIYRYVKTLKDANLVIEVGQRVVPGKKATEKLYGLLARWISSQGKYDPNWESDIRLWLLDASARIFRFLYPDLPPVNKQRFKEFRISNSKCRDEGMQMLKLQKNRKAFELLHAHTWKDFYLMTSTLMDYYFFMNIPNMYEQLRKCFSE